jgi:hypothetical protein
MAQTNVVMGTGVALAGLGGLAGGALIANHRETPKPAATPAAQAVETQTVVVRTVEHRTIHVKPKHRRQRVVQAAAAPAPAAVAPAPVVVRATPVVQAAPTHIIHTQPVHTRTSGGSHGTSHGGDDGGHDD